MPSPPYPVVDDLFKIVARNRRHRRRKLFVVHALRSFLTFTVGCSGLIRLFVRKLARWKRRRRIV
jgi:hypothetical protein